MSDDIELDKKRMKIKALLQEAENSYNRSSAFGSKVKDTATDKPTDLDYGMSALHNISDHPALLGGAMGVGAAVNGAPDIAKQLKAYMSPADLDHKLLSTNSAGVTSQIKSVLSGAGMDQRMAGRYRRLLSTYKSNPSALNTILNAGSINGMVQPYSRAVGAADGVMKGIGKVIGNTNLSAKSLAPITNILLNNFPSILAKHKAERAAADFTTNSLRKALPGSIDMGAVRKGLGALSDVKPASMLGEGLSLAKRHPRWKGAGKYGLIMGTALAALGAVDRYSKGTTPAHDSHVRKQKMTMDEALGLFNRAKDIDKEVNP